jgi:PBP1b-binding outer membrane lipoprotein LpoB
MTLIRIIPSIVISLFLLNACQSAQPYASSANEKTISVSTEHVSEISAPLLTPIVVDQGVPRCEKFTSNMALAEQKLDHQPAPMTVIDAL